MGLQHAINLGFTTDLDIIAGLYDVNTIVPLVDTLGCFHTHSGIFGFDMLADFFNEQLAGRRNKCTDGKIIDLLAREDFLAINNARVYVPFMGSIVESHLVDENIRDQTLP